MIRDQLFKRIFIPLAGLCFPFVAGLSAWDVDRFLPTIFTVFFFTGAVMVMWWSIVRSTMALRSAAPLRKNIFLKLLTIFLVAAVAAALLGMVATVAWLWINKLPFTTAPVWRAGLFAGVSGAVLALVYEAVFLSVEKELDTRVLQQIDRERQEAEVNVLRNELDPHFFFNCMNALSHLVREDSEKAHQFVHNLSNIYKYFLRNKATDYVSLNDELEFLEAYSFLLRIRFDETIRIENTIDPQNGSAFILPCALQVLVENAMKHNFFSEKEPLVVTIGMNSYFITVSNPVRPKLHATDSTNVGLRNLKARYRLITNQNVLVQKTATKFLVKLPVVKQTNRYDKSSDH